jgi:hypothetical protein
MTVGVVAILLIITAIFISANGQITDVSERKEII